MITRNEVMETLGFPDRILTSKSPQRLKACVWRCRDCRMLKGDPTGIPITNPAPCACGSIFFLVYQP